MQNPNEGPQSADGGIQEEQTKTNEPVAISDASKKSPWKVAVPIVLVVVVIVAIIWLVM